MNILIITKSFVKEVSYLVRYAAHVDQRLRFRVVMPYSDKEPLPAPFLSGVEGFVSIRKLFFPKFPAMGQLVVWERLLV